MRTSERTTSFWPAFLAAVSVIPALRKSKTNPDTNSKYIPLDAIVDAVRPILAKEGIIFVQSASATNGVMNVVTRFVHAPSDEWLETDSCVPIIGRYKSGGGRHDADAQAAGSAISYARRYGLAAALAIVSDTDDDGRAARRSEGQARPTAQPRERKAAPKQLQYVKWVMPIGPKKGARFEEIDSDELRRVMKKALDAGQTEIADDIGLVLADRETPTGVSS